MPFFDVVLLGTDLVVVCVSWLSRWAFPLSCSMLTPAQPPTSLSGSTRSSEGQGHILDMVLLSLTWLEVLKSCIISVWGL